MSKHTPGPWYRLPGKRMMIGVGGVVVCTVRDNHPSAAEGKDNACVMANRADAEDWLNEMTVIAEQARTALAKARGES